MESVLTDIVIQPTCSEDIFNITSSNNEEHPVIVTLPPMECHDWCVKKETKYSSYELDLNSIPQIEELDNYLLSWAKMRKTDLNVSRYKSMIRYDTLQRVFKIKILTMPDSQTLITKHSNDICLTSDEYEVLLCPGCLVEVTIELVALWIRNKTIGVHVRTRQIKILGYKQPRKILSNSI